MPKDTNAEALATMAESTSNPKVASAIRSASASGVGVLSILAAIASNLGDFEAIYSALMKLVVDVVHPATPTPPAPTPAS